MTSVQNMLTALATTNKWAIATRWAGCSRLALGVLVLAAAAGCMQGPELDQPSALVAPYPPTTPLPLWAVAPFNNESGTSAVDSLAVTDAVIARASEVQGLATIPLNRTIAAMRTLRMAGIRSPSDAQALAEALGADAVVVGSITAYDPYNPPKMGLTLGIFFRPGSRLGGEIASLDPTQLRVSPTDPTLSQSVQTARPESVVSDYLDANNHQVLASLQDYARGRYDRTNPLGWRKYLVSMDLYTEFAAFEAVAHLLQAERARLAAADRPEGRSGGLSRSMP